MLSYSGSFCNNKKLLAKESPRERQVQINLQRRNRILSPPGHGERQEAIDRILDLIPRVAKHLHKRELRQGEIMIPEIPVKPRNILDVRAHGDQSSPRLQRPKRLFQCALEVRLGRQVLEEITGKHRVEDGLVERPRLRTVLLNYLDILPGAVPGFRVQVHRQFAAGLYIINELTITAPEVQHGRLGRRPLGEVPHQHLPYTLTIGDAARKAVPVDAVQVFGRMC